MKSKLTDKFYLWILLPVLLIVAGLIVFFTVGFPPSSTVADSKSLVVTCDALPGSTDSAKEDFIRICNDAVKAEGVSYTDYIYAQKENGGEIEYKFSYETSDARLREIGEAVQTAVAAEEKFAGVVTSVEAHSNVAEYTYTYIWRAAIVSGVALVLAFIYIAIRYQMAMGLSALIAGLLDTAATVGLVLICRIPVTPSLAVAAIFATLYSVFLSTVCFNRLREQLKREDLASLPVEEAVAAAHKGAVKPVLLLGACVAAIFVALVFCGTALREFALAAICGVAVCTFSGALLSPSLVACFKKQWAKHVAAKEEKQRLRRLEEEKEKSADQKSVKA